MTSYTQYELEVMTTNLRLICKTRANKEGNMFCVPGYIVEQGAEDILKGISTCEDKIEFLMYLNNQYQ